MHFLNDHESFNALERIIIGLTQNAESMRGWTDCAETTEPECLRMQADLLELRAQVLALHKRYLGEVRWRALTDEDIVAIVRRGEQA
jgi:K+/H+ antiporter YhaU regulatory subunit KhtT